MKRRPFAYCLLTLALALVWSSPASGAPASRFNDPQPHRGGAEIRMTVLGETYNCSSGFAVRRVEDGKRAMTTAGHCPNGLINVDTTSGQYPFGRFVRTFYDNVVDAALVAGTPQSPQVYAPTLWTDGGPQGTPVARRVLGKADGPVVDQKVCVSGKVTKLVCDIEVYNLTSGQSCGEEPPHICTNGLVLAGKEGKNIVKAGDSGAPVFVPIDTEIDGHKVYGAMLVGMLVGGGPRIEHGPEDLVTFHPIKQIECSLNVKVLTTADAESGDTTPPPPRDDCAGSG
ncbi:hypothetical protein [Streptomyces formicae]|uniref:Streptogrisin-C (Serine protease C) (SGPC) n=1 Tax=Streptomyces formicae TaxID=1616117 RepID=A0A291Q2M1_9ACTN|nr:hypothetical protein [Streptomyces formicae]ATL25735.1 Streptogrisin-C precursor (Serine protease C) (SGPC) [Streptomyces formicae]